MKKILVVLGLVLAFPQLAEAQSQRNPCVYLSTSNNNCQPVGSSTNGVGNSPMPVGGLATAGAPTYVEGMMGGLSFDLGGALRVSSGGGGITAAVTVANGADVAEGSTTDSPATTPTTASAATIISLLKSLANSNTSSVPAGTNVIGHVITDTSSTTAATQATAANLNATVVGTGTFATQATLAAETTKVIGTVNQGTSPWVASGTFAIDQTTAGTTNAVVITPSSASGVGLTPVVSATAEASHVLKASAGNAYYVYATNLTATAGFLLLLNSTTAPADGAVSPIGCAPLAPNGSASLAYAPGPPGVFSTGITAVVTSAVTCFTKTTGVITAFISGSVK